MKIIVDTCVIIDALQKREPFMEDAIRLCYAVANQKCDAFVPAKSVADLYYILHRSLHSDALTRTALKKLFHSFGILDTTEMDCRNALTSQMPDFEDAMLAETAYRNKIDYIVTRNLKDYKHSDIPACSPQEILNIMNLE
ncbi:MAG: PIN domain-containing protein [Lachnospiraceae bacterium]|nr:PIN domain-containing protein [Lachnospiraceae bacterium]